MGVQLFCSSHIESIIPYALIIVLWWIKLNTYSIRSINISISCNQHLYYLLMTSRIRITQCTQSILNSKNISIIKQYRLSYKILERWYTLSWKFTSTFFVSKYSTMSSCPWDAAICSSVLSYFTKKLYINIRKTNYLSLRY